MLRCRGDERQQKPAAGVSRQCAVNRS
jgi:hypothetical protein